MYYKDQYNPDDKEYDTGSCAGSVEQRVMLEESKKKDRGYNKLWRSVLRESTGKMKRTKIEFYTSSCMGSHIRDAETGEFYADKVGTCNEDLYFKVGLSTGECKSSNGSNTLFYSSPYRYMTHMHVILSREIIKKWEEKKNLRLKMIEQEVKKPSAATVIVK